MTRGRHRLRVTVATAPVLAVALMVAVSQSPWVLLAAVAAWAATVVLAEGWLWRSCGGHLAAVQELLDAPSAESVGWTLRELRSSAELCRRDRDRLNLLLEDLSESIGEGLLVVGPELEVRLASPVARQFCGIATIRTGTHLLEVLRDPEAVAVVERAARGQHPAPLVVENARGLWEVRAFPVRDGGAVVLTADVSVVRRASEFRRRFVQDLSHELRSPLTVLRTTVETLEDEVPAELAGVLVRQVERLDRLSRELYELASLESGEVELSLESVPLARLVAEVVQDFRPEAERSSVEIRTSVEDGLLATCDRRGLYRVLSNLMDNAVKYNRPGGRVEVTARRADAGDRVEIRVADSGEGIPAVDLKAVFQRFYRVDRARTPGRGGLGLGLAIVKHLVQHMGGTLDLDSREGVGTTVTLGFPASPRLSGSVARSGG